MPKTTQARGSSYVLRLRTRREGPQKSRGEGGQEPALSCPSWLRTSLLKFIRKTHFFLDTGVYICPLSHCWEGFPASQRTPLGSRPGWGPGQGSAQLHEEPKQAPRARVYTPPAPGPPARGQEGRCPCRAKKGACDLDRFADTTRLGNPRENFLGGRGSSSRPQGLLGPRDTGAPKKQPGRGEMEPRGQAWRVLLQLQARGCPRSPAPHAGGTDPCLGHRPGAAPSAGLGAGSALPLRAGWAVGHQGHAGQAQVLPGGSLGLLPNPEKRPPAATGLEDALWGQSRACGIPLLSLPMREGCWRRKRSQLWQ